MPFGNVTKNDLAKFFAHGTSMPAYGASWYLHLHTASPGGAGTSSTNEAAYDNYTRIAASRDSGGFTICDSDGTVNASGAAFKNAAEITFPECDSAFVGSETIVAISLCDNAGQIIRYAVLSVDQQIVVNANDTPRIPAGAAIFNHA